MYETKQKMKMMMMMMMMMKEKVGERHEKKPLGKEEREQGTAVF